MSTSRTSLPQEAPAASGEPAPAPSAATSSPTEPPASTPGASTRPDLLTTVALIVFIGVYSTFFFPFRYGLHLIPSDAALWTKFALYAALLAVGGVAFRHPLARAARQVMAHKRRSLLTLIVGGIATTAIAVVGALASSTLLDLTDLSEAGLQNDSNIGTVMQTFPPIVIVVVLGIVGPIVEEMVFRQILIGLIGRFVPTWVAVVVSSILFGALHMSSFALSEVLGVLPHAFFGLGLGLLYVRTDCNLLYPASIHCLNNLSAALPLLLR